MCRCWLPAGAGAVVVALHATVREGRQQTSTAPLTAQGSSTLFLASILNFMNYTHFPFSADIGQRFFYSVMKVLNVHGLFMHQN